MTWRGSSAGRRTWSATTCERCGALGWRAPAATARSSSTASPAPAARSGRPRSHRREASDEHRPLGAIAPPALRERRALARGVGRLTRRARWLSWASLAYMAARGRGRAHRRARRRLDRAARLRARLGDRGLRQHRDRLALQRHPPALRPRRAARPAARRDPVLPARPVLAPRRSATCSAASTPRQLARDRPGDQLVVRCRCSASPSSASAAPGLGRDPGRRRPEPALRVHGRRAAGGPGRQRAVRPVVAGPAAALAIAGLAVREGAKLAWRELLRARRPAGRAVRRRLLPLSTDTRTASAAICQRSLKTTEPSVSGHVSGHST